MVPTKRPGYKRRQGQGKEIRNTPEAKGAPLANRSTDQRVNQPWPYLVNVALVTLFFVAS